MRYTEFSFKNFKGIEELTLELTGDVTTLIGLNESGKTTILEAIFCFTYGAENLDALDPSMASLRDAERWVPISQRGNFNDTIEVSATVELSSEDQKKYRQAMVRNHGLSLANTPKRIIITERYTFTNSRLKGTQKLWTLSVEGTKGRQQNRRTYGNNSDEWQGAVAYLKGELPSIWYFPNFLFELPERFDLEATPVGGETGDKNAFYRLTFERILAQIGGGATLDSHVVHRLKSEEKADQRSLASLLLDLGQEITRTVFDGWNRIFGRAPLAQEVNILADTDQDGNAYLELKIKGPDGYYDLSERSLGFRWFFMFLLMTSYRGLSHDRSGIVFLLDEPASNLHSSAQAELLKSFEALAQTCQLVYTTHSHHLINIRWLDSAYVVANEALGDLSMDEYLFASTRGRTSISATPYRRFVSENPSRTSYFQPVLDVLEYRPSELEPVPAVVLVEGKSDFYLLRYVTDVLGVKTSCKFVPGGGAGTLDTLIRMYIGWAKSFVVLLDGDKEGVKQKERYERVFGPFLAKRCVLLPEATEPSVRKVEDLFDEVDREKLIGAVHGTEGPRTKKVLLTAIMELYARGDPITLSASSMAPMKLLLESLTKMLSEQPE